MANLAESSIWETGVYQIEENDPVHGGANGITNRPTKQLANRTVWLKNELASSVQTINASLASLSTNKADKTLNLVAGNGLTGGGTLQASRTVALGTPSQITASTTNSVTATSHTHAIDKASTTVAGVVQLVDNLITDDATKALTAKQGKVLHDNKLDKTANAVSASRLATARTINGVPFDGTANITITDNTKAPAVHRHNWNEIDGKPSTFTPSSHTHTIANIADYDVRQISTEDLDSITKWGIYGQAANNQSLTERNYPVPNEAGTLEVMPGTYGLRQRFTTFVTHRQFERSRNNAMTGWNAWTELSNTWSAIRDKPSNLAYTSSNVASATKLQTLRNIAMTGDGSWNVNFDGSQNATGALTLANSGVTAGSYNSVTVDAKGRVTRGLSQVHGLITATTATGTANQATTNTNTYLNIVASGVGSTASVGSSTQVTGTGGISVSSDTSGKLIISRDSNSPTATQLQTARTINGVAFDGTQNITIYDNTKLASNGNAVSASRLATARTISLTGAVTGSVSFNGSANVSITTALNLADFANSKTENGYQKLPNGLIIQWGIGHAGRVGTDYANRFPISFPTACQTVQAIHIGTNDSVNTIINGITTTGFNARSNYQTATTVVICWLAIGY